jgi:hypothetical protein
MTAPAVAGSPKPSKRRRTRHITLRQAENLFAALEFAEAIGYRLNVSVDICWPMFSGFTDDQTRIARCQERLSKWFKRRGFPLTMIWVREIGKNGAPNVHMLIFVPPWLMENGDFQLELERAFEPEGGPAHDKAIMIQPAYDPMGKLLYVLKGLRPSDAKQFRRDGDGEGWRDVAKDGDPTRRRTR